MARPKVPHCKECSFLTGHPKGWSDKYGSWRCTRCDRWINGQEVRTSPSWCPLRRPRAVPLVDILCGVGH